MDMKLQNAATMIALAIIFILPLSSGLYFHIGETERKCFIEEIPDETMVTGKENFEPDCEEKKRPYFLLLRKL